MLTLFTQTYEKMVKLIFDIYDFDNDGMISRNDIKIIFSYITLKTKNLASLIRFKYEQNDISKRNESLREIEKYLDKIFETNDYLTEEQFLNSIMEVSSEVFLYVI